MNLDIQPAGSPFRFSRYVRETPKPGTSAKIRQMLGFTPRRRLVARPDEAPAPFDFAVVSGERAEAALAELRVVRPNCTPVILGNRETAADTFIKDRRPVVIDEAVRELSRFDAGRWVAECLRQTEMQVPHGPWPESRGTENARCLASVETRKPRGFEPEIAIAIVPTAEPALVAVHLDYGDWNGSPSPLVHAGLARRWAAQYGAVPVAFAGDVLEYQVSRPAQTREEALNLALDQFAFCPDIVWQGCETIEGLAAELIGARYWFFWWD